MDVDTSELRQFSADLQLAAERMPDEAKKVVGRGCFQIKKDWQARWTGHPHIKHLPRTINYDVTQVGDVITGEVGPDKSKGGQAPLANLIEFGSVNSAPIPGGAPALDAEAPRFERALADLGVDLLEKP